MDKNSFGRQLEEILLQSNVKNASIAKELNYDVSYISKWITGKTLPSKKNIEKVIFVISEVVVRQSNDKSLAALQSVYGAKHTEELREIIQGLLRDAYYDALGETDERVRINNALLKSSVKGEIPLWEQLLKTIEEKNDLNIIFMIDLFALDHASKLKMAGIVEHKFMFEHIRKDITLDYIIDISQLQGRSIYDVILLIHMMTCFSLTNFHLYYHVMASGKMIQVAENQFAGITLLGENKQFLCTTSTKEHNAINGLAENLKSHMDPDKTVFFETDMNKLLLRHEYMQTVISPDARWLVGHMTEQFISPELFEILSKELFSGDMLEEVRRAYQVARSCITRNQVKIMFYSLALMDFVLAGELDFFNQKVMLTPQQRVAELKYLKELLKKTDKNQIKLVNEGFSEDFKYVTNPCVFLSSSLGYLRLENKQYEGNILLIRDEKMRKVFDEFYNEIWDEKQSEVISDQEVIMKKIDNLLITAQLLYEIE